MAEYTAKQMAEMLAQLQAENQALKTKLEEQGTSQVRSLSIRQSGDKGTLGVYGLTNRFPVSLYASQWFRLAEAMPRVLAFLADPANRKSLAWKADTDPDKVVADAIDDIRVAFARFLDEQKAKANG